MVLLLLVKYVCIKLRHPSIVNIVGVCYEVSQLLLVTDYIDGSNLHQIIFYNSCDVSETHMSCMSPNKQVYFHLDTPKRPD